jgi:hypothetical protein
VGHSQFMQKSCTMAHVKNPSPLRTFGTVWVKVCSADLAGLTYQTHQAGWEGVLWIHRSVFIRYVVGAFDT